MNRLDSILESRKTWLRVLKIDHLLIKSRNRNSVE